MQHPIDESDEILTGALLAAAPPDCARLPLACETAAAAYDQDPTRPRGIRAATVLTELNADCPLLLLAVLGDPRLREHFDPVEARARFGEEVAGLLGQLHHLNDFTERRLRGGRADQSENLRRLIVSMIGDIRVLLVKLVYRLERLRALPRVIDFDERRRVARETLDIHAPLAHRLGLGQLKWELEDLAFRHLEPDTYKQMARLIEERREAREAYIDDARQRLQHALSEAGIPARIHGRPKHLYSIFNKMRRKRLPFDQLFDVRALRVHVDDIEDCYAALSVVQSLWEPIPGEYDDYIANPKPNGYQSLHTAVRAREGKTLEVQIRTDEMHASAELGVAAHWRYKEGGRGGPDRFQSAMERLRQALEEGESTEVDLGHVYVFTPIGELIELPRGATPLDMAYKLHTELGHRCRGARVNGRLVPLNSPLHNADRVEILAGHDAAPKRDWIMPELGYLTTRHAIGRVKAWFRARERESARETGQDIWEKLIRRLSLSREQQTRLLTQFNLRSREALFEALGENRIDRDTLLQAARRTLAPTQSDLPPPAPLLDARHVEDGGITLSGMMARPANCCDPAPGQPVVAFITRGQGLRLHRADCPNLQHLARQHPERIMEVTLPDNLALPRQLELELWLDPGTNAPDDDPAAHQAALMRELALALGQFKARMTAQEGRQDRRRGQWRMKISIRLPPDQSPEALIEKLAGSKMIHQVRRLR